MEKNGPRLRASRKRQKVLLSLLRQIRIERDLRQADIAERLGCPQSAVSKYENGERRPDLLELYDLCSAIGISITGLVKRFEQEAASVSQQPPKRRTAARPR